MGVIDTFSELIGADKRQFRFRCTDCETEFAQRAATVDDLTCPACGAGSVRPAETA